VLPHGADPATFEIGTEAYVDAGNIFNSGFLDGLSIDDAKKKIAEHFGALTVDGKPQLVVPYSVTNNDGQFGASIGTSDQWFSFVRDAFDMLEEDYAEERFFAIVRRQYWASAPDAPTRDAAQVLITALEF